MVHQDERPANGFVCGSFFCVMCDGKACAWCTIPYGAGSCCAAVRLAFASRGPVAKNSALHCFPNAPADSTDLQVINLQVFFVIGKCFCPDRWAAGIPKAGRTLGGPAVQSSMSLSLHFRISFLFRAAGFPIVTQIMQLVHKL